MQGFFMQLTPELVAQWADAFENLSPWAFGALVLVLYRKQISAALQRSTENPLVEAIQTQSAHFAENNRLFQALGPALVDLRTNTGEAAAHGKEIVRLLTDLLAVQRSIERQLLLDARGRIQP
jgi:hypothetical protein